MNEKKMNDKRKDMRHDFSSVIEYSIAANSGNRVLKGVTVNLCESGISLYLFGILRRGQEITIRSELPVSRRTASVRWIRRIDGEMFRAGLMFV